MKNFREMAISLLKNQNISTENFSMLATLADHTGFKEGIIKMFLESKDFDHTKEKEIKECLSLGIIRFQIGRSSKCKLTKEQWEKDCVRWCEFNEGMFLGYLKEDWVEFFLYVSKIEGRTVSMVH